MRALFFLPHHHFARHLNSNLRHLEILLLEVFNRLHLFRTQDCSGAIEDALQVAGIGQHHGDVVNGRQLIDPLAKLEFLEAEAGDGVGQEEEKLDGRGLGNRDCARGQHL